MIHSLLWSTAWILSGAAVFAALYWSFLTTPESTVFMLALSLTLAIAMGLVLGVTFSGALVGWSRGWSGGVLRRAVTGVPAFIVAALFVLAAWWLIGRALGWMDAHSGEISAWFIATFNWADVRPVFTTVHYVGDWLRMLVAPFAGLVWLSDGLGRGWQPLMDRAWVARALSPTRLALATVAAGVLIAAPVTYGLYWVPAGLPPTWIEPAFAVAKGAAMAVIAAIGLSLIARLAVRPVPAR
jgi:hypothetical protein